MGALRAFAYDPNDTDEARLEKVTIALVAGSCTVAGGVWTLMYYVVFGMGLTALLPFCSSLSCRPPF